MTLPPEQRTMRTPAPDGGEMIEPIPGMGVCDFCTATPVAWEYPCGAVVILNHISADSWGACQGCHQLIQGNEHVQLIVRALDAAVAQHGPMDRADVEFMAQTIAVVHKSFHNARLGEPRPT
jgi:hypothetical protein